jgi:hypothetical protein
VAFHFTPTSASWLNQIEIWFGILGRKAMNGASFNSTQELAQAIDAFCGAWHENATPSYGESAKCAEASSEMLSVNLLG